GAVGTQHAEPYPPPRMPPQLQSEPPALAGIPPPTARSSCSACWPPVQLLRAVLATPRPAPRPPRVLASPPGEVALLPVATEAALVAVIAVAPGRPQLVALHRAGRERQRLQQSAHRLSAPPGRPRATPSARRPANPPTSRARPGAPRCERRGRDRLGSPRG